MLKTSSTKSTEPKKGVVGVDDSGRNRAELASKHEVDGDKVDGVKVDDELDDEVEKNQKMSSSRKLSKFKKTVGSSDFLISGAKLAFTKLKQVFLKILIL